MPEQMRPASKEQAPDPSNSYERSHPESESPAGKLDTPKPLQGTGPDKAPAAVKNAQDGSKQLNAHDEKDQQGKSITHPTATPSK